LRVAGRGTARPARPRQRRRHPAVRDRTSGPAGLIGTQAHIGRSSFRGRLPYPQHAARAGIKRADRDSQTAAPYDLNSIRPSSAPPASLRVARSRSGAERRRAVMTPQDRRRHPGVRSEPVAQLMHAGGTARVALALRAPREDVDELLAPRPGLLIGHMLGLPRCKCRISNRP
jgi:hypothetical protein